jgi:hypothetical protein
MLSFAQALIVKESERTADMVLALWRKYLALPDIEPRFACRPAHRLFTIPSELKADSMLNCKTVRPDGN